MMTPDSALSLAMAEYNCKQWRLLSSISDISAGALPVDDVERPGVVQALTFLAHRLAQLCHITLRHALRQQQRLGGLDERFYVYGYQLAKPPTPVTNRQLDHALLHLLQSRLLKKLPQVGAVARVYAALLHGGKHRIGNVLCRRSHRIVAIMPLDHLNPAAGTGNTAEFIDDKLPAVARDGKEEQPLMHEIKRSVREWQPFQNIAGNEAIIFWE